MYSRQHAVTTIKLQCNSLVWPVNMSRFPSEDRVLQHRLVLVLEAQSQSSRLARPKVWDQSPLLWTSEDIDLESSPILNRVHPKHRFFPRLRRAEEEQHSIYFFFKGRRRAANAPVSSRTARVDSVGSTHTRGTRPPSQHLTPRRCKAHSGLQVPRS